MTKYTCPEKGCDVVIEGHDTIHEVLAHEEEHKKNKREVTKTEKITCKHCDGKGFNIEEYTVEEDVSEAD